MAEQLLTSNDKLHGRIHVLSVVDHLHFGGDEYRLLAFAQSVDPCRFQHTVVTLLAEDQRTAERCGSMRQQYRHAGVRLIDFGFSPAEGSQKKYSKLTAFREKVRQLKTFVRQERVDVLDVHLSPANLTCAAVSLAVGAPCVITLYQLNEVQSADMWVAGQLNLGRARLLITDSEAQASQIRRWVLRDVNVLVIPNGTSPPRPALSRESVLERLDIPKQAELNIIAQVSRLISYKGHLVLLDAAKRVLERRPDCIFLLVGYEQEAGYKQRLQLRASELGITDRVRIVSYPGQIGDIWNVIDIHAHASFMDSLPNALLEAMSLGKASVITSVGGIPEVIDHGVNGLLAKPNDPGLIATHLLKLLGDSELRSQIGSAAHHTYAQRFRAEIMTRRLEDCFRAVVSKSSSNLPNRFY
jgi:glycosyltransferase involved in cell wall biosynthesis